MLKLLKHLSSRDWLRVGFCVVFVVVQVWLDLKIPDYMSEITQLVQTAAGDMSEIWAAGFKMLLCAFGSLAASVIVGFFSSRVSAAFSQRLRSLLFDKVEGFSMGEINRFSTSSLITRSTNDITQVQMFIAMGLQVIIKSPVTAVWAIAKILGKNLEWSVATACTVIFMVIIIVILLIFAFPKFKVLQKLTDNLNLVTRENLTGVRVVRAYNAEGYQEDKFDTVNKKLVKTNLFTGRLMSLLMPCITLALNGLSLSIYWIGAYLIDGAPLENKMTLFSDMVVFSSYAMQVVMSFMMLVMIFIFMPRASVSARRINEVLKTSSSINDGEFGGKTEAFGDIEFRNVSFKYPDGADNVLENISFSARRGETVAFIGSTGSGKTTLVNLIPRFYDATEGEVIVDGVNVKDYTLEALHNKLGYVSQKAVLFTGTVTSNISYGENGKPEVSESGVKEAAETAQCGEFVEKMEDGYNGYIAAGGTNVSGGQKQRLSIARAIARKPEVLIFDDSFSALDYKTDRVLRSALKKNTDNATVLIVAQRIGTIKDADRIVVLDEGRAVGIGTHEQLMESCEVYREIAYSQLSKEELGNE